MAIEVGAEVWHMDDVRALSDAEVGHRFPGCLSSFHAPKETLPSEDASTVKVACSSLESFAYASMSQDRVRSTPVTMTRLL
jgi:hypothetical protein